MSTPRIALAVCMRNEGIFLMEWLAHHAGLGFSHIFVVTNDCTDGSDWLLDRLQAHHILTHIRQTVPPGENPQETGMDLVLQACREQGFTHILHIDSDEFLDLRSGNAEVSDLLKQAPNADVIPLPWRFFGDEGCFEWVPGDLVLEQNRRAERAPNAETTKYKCLFRVEAFARAGEHAPKDALVADPVASTPEGRPLHNITLTQKHTARWQPYRRAANTKAAWLSHYAVRSLDVFLMKNDRGKGTGVPNQGKYVAGARWYEICNRNDASDSSMVRYVSGIKERLALWRKDLRIRELEQNCRDWFLARRVEVLTDERLEDWTRAKEVTSPEVSVRN